MNIEQLVQQLFDPNAQAIQPLDAFRVAVALIITFILSIIIIQVYKYTQKRSFLSQNFVFLFEKSLFVHQQNSNTDN